jgi:hypothetical protein
MPGSDPDFDDFEDESDEPASDAPPDRGGGSAVATAFEDPVESYAEEPWEPDFGGEE